MFGACGGGDTEGGRSAGVATRASTTAVGLETASLLDDRLIAYSTGDAMNSDIQVSKWDGSDPVRLTDAPGFEYDPEWSPDGAKIAYRVEPPGEDFGPSYIYVMDSDGSSQTNLSERSGLLGSAPSWSPDGERVVFAGGPKDAVCSESACGTADRYLRHERRRIKASTADLGRLGGAISGLVSRWAPNRLRLPRARESRRLRHERGWIAGDAVDGRSGTGCMARVVARR